MHTLKKNKLTSVSSELQISHPLKTSDFNSTLLKDNSYLLGININVNDLLVRVWRYNLFSSWNND